MNESLLSARPQECLVGCRPAVFLHRVDCPNAEQRFTLSGAECRVTHRKGYTGPICSCDPMTCRAVAT